MAISCSGIHRSHQESRCALSTPTGQDLDFDWNRHGMFRLSHGPSEGAFVQEVLGRAADFQRQIN